MRNEATLDYGVFLKAAKLVDADRSEDGYPSCWAIRSVGGARHENAYVRLILNGQYHPLYLFGPLGSYDKAEARNTRVLALLLMATIVKAGDA